MGKTIAVDVILAALTAGVLLMGGCAVKPEPTPVQAVKIIRIQTPVSADADPADWGQASPVFVDPARQARLFLSNTEDTLCLLVTVKDPETARQMARSSVTLAVDTGEKGAKPFSVTLEGNQFLKFIPTPGTNAPASPRVEVSLPDTVNVVYPFSSGAMTMSEKEARSNGISLGLAGNATTWTFEAVIRLDTIFFNPYPKNAPLTVSILSKGGKQRPLPRKTQPDHQAFSIQVNTRLSGKA